MNKTTGLGIFGLISAIGAIGTDALNGGGFAFNDHLAAFLVAFGSLGLIFVRDAIQKVINVTGADGAKK